MALRQAQNDFAIRRFNCLERKLRNDADFVFHVHLHVIRAKNRRGHFKDFGKFPGGQPMVEIIGKPGLQAAMRVVTQSAAAIYKALVNPGHFRDVRVGGNAFAVWQHEPQMCGRPLIQFVFQFGDFHKPHEHFADDEQQSGSRKAQQAGTARTAPTAGAIRYNQSD